MTLQPATIAESRGEHVTQLWPSKIAGLRGLISPLTRSGPPTTSFDGIRR